MKLAHSVGTSPALVLFYALVVFQGAHLGEHIAQMVQIHLLGLSGPNAHGIVGALDIEWVHFVWNTGVIVSLFALLLAFPRNRWLWLTAVLAGWHEAEHSYILSVYLASGVSGTPGLLSQGGVIGGGLPVTRPDLHFMYNMLETLPLVIGFLDQVRHTPLARKYSTRHWRRREG
jgi:hypothetical protein